MKEDQNHKNEISNETAALLEKSAVFLALTTAEKIILGFRARGYTQEDIALETQNSLEYIEIIENRLRKKLENRNTDEMNQITRLFNMV